MKKDEIEHLWKIASNDPSHDSNWFDPVVIKFAELIEEKKQADIDTLYALYQQACQQRDELMDQQRSMIAAMRGKLQ